MGGGFGSGLGGGPGFGGGGGGSGAWLEVSAAAMARPARSKSSALSGHPTSTIEAAVACGFVAIAQIMDLHGDNAPTRLSIKSHLQ